MLKRFETWPDVLEHVRSGRPVWYVPSDSVGPCPTVARVRHTGEGDTVRLWLRCPEGFVNSYPSTIADETFLDKIYRWEPTKGARR